MDIVEWPEVDPKVVWPHEAFDFTPWLAQNLDQLGEPLGLDLELVDTEVNVGPFHADVVARTLDGKDVVIENQLMGSNHDHLGKLLTYAAGLDADYVVWIAPSFKPEHLAALRWINEGSKEGLAFFALTIEAIALGEDQAAVRLKPAIEVELADLVDEDRLSEAQKQAQVFWTPVLSGIKQKWPGWVHATKASKQPWMTLPAGGASYWYAISFAKKAAKLRVEFYTSFPDGSAHLFQCLQQRSEQIEQAFGEPLSWEPLPGKKATRIAAYTPGVIEEKTDWPQLQQWAVDRIGRLRDAIAPHLAECASSSADET